MGLRRSAAILVACGCVHLGAALAQRASTAVSVTISVTVPADTPNDGDVFLAGNLMTPAWRPNGVRMDRVENARYATKLELPAAATLEYKFTRGSWDTVEKAESGADISNRRLKVEPGLVVTDVVRRWGAGSGGPGTAAAHTRVGTFREHPDFASAHLTSKRTVIVYLPPNYEAAASAAARYPVLYMHDGQNLFDRATGFGGQEWRIDETAEALIRAGKIQPIIIVGVYNTAARMTEYTPVGASPTPGRSGEDYTRFLVEELKPFIDKTYRTRPGRGDTAVAGSSLGGLISLSMAITHPETFGKAGVVSASLFWNDGQLLKEVEKRGRALTGVKFWVDIGTKEGRTEPGEAVNATVRNARRLIDLFRAAGLVEGTDYFYLEVPDGEHNEKWWAQRMDQMLLYLFPRAGS
jgi:predicted alpha/beta superfamily hydrolase